MSIEERAAREVNALLIELLEQSVDRIDPVNEVDAYMLSKALGLSNNTAYRRLMKLEKKGVLKSRFVMGRGGHRERAWRKA